MHKFPPFLKKGDEIHIISTARKITLEELKPAIEIIESHGYTVVLGHSLFKEFHQWAGTDDDRATDLQEAINNPKCKAILCARGGYGTVRIIDKIDFSTLHTNPKWIIGFSDVTVLHEHLHTLGHYSIHGTMPVVFQKEGNEQALHSLFNILNGKSNHYNFPSHQYNKTGRCLAPIIGGNLSLIHALIGTPSDINTDGKILFLEDLDEYLYHIDRMITHLKRAGKFSKLAGLIIGDMSDMKDNTIPFGKNAYEIIAEHTQEYNFPICFGAPIGHEADNRAIICGHTTELIVNQESSSIIQILS